VRVVYPTSVARLKAINLLDFELSIHVCAIYVLKLLSFLKKRYTVTDLIIHEFTIDHSKESKARKDQEKLIKKFKANPFISSIKSLSVIKIKSDNQLGPKVLSAILENNQ